MHYADDFASMTQPCPACPSPQHSATWRSLWKRLAPRSDTEHCAAFQWTLNPVRFSGLGWLGQPLAPRAYTLDALGGWKVARLHENGLHPGCIGWLESGVVTWIWNTVLPKDKCGFAQAARAYTLAALELPT